MTILHCGRFRLDLSRPLVMGILNMTPDSFSDGGRHAGIEQALQHAREMVAEGADIIDIGGESTRPNAPLVSPEQEMERVLPLLERLQDLGVPLSLDTRRRAVMAAALPIGVDLINDVSALEDEGALALLAGSTAAICLMHKQGNPDTMQLRPDYRNVVDEVGAYLARRVALCEEGGIARARLLIDPGFGFGKTLEHNLQLLRGLPELARAAGGIPLLVGLSRKTMLGAVCDEDVPSERLGASVAAALEAVRRGAHIVRVHDVKATRQALQLWNAVKSA
ncbi:dihydropteroate synthase [Paludibacterium yongneupense]|uniref:dihydropteroate synthase n=1 Tax=Paludibacterium yongneupense TaxID=400061 RepID=UPI0003FF3BDF|nr:dihydropteroate synthase [Paludibacterium yongneupense]